MILPIVVVDIRGNRSRRIRMQACRASEMLCSLEGPQTSLIRTPMAMLVIFIAS